MWTAFALFVAIALVLDLRVMRQRGPHRIGTREALGWSVIWIALAMVFNAGLWWHLSETHGTAIGTEKALEFLTGYLVEKALAVDNIFVFLLLFTYFAVPAEQQQRVLVYGVLGAIVLRAIMIFIGAALIARFHWILYGFGAFLVLTGIKMLWTAGKSPDLAENPLLRWITRHVPMADGYHGDRFWIGDGAARRYTPLFVVMLLRALFFLLADMAERFHLLVYGLATVLLFVGGKMLLMDVWKIPVLASLAVVALTIGASMAASLLWPAPQATPSAPPHPRPGA
jgi:tellurite resistance protein TerC